VERQDGFVRAENHAHFSPRRPWDIARTPPVWEADTPCRPRPRARRIRRATRATASAPRTALLCRRAPVPFVAARGAAVPRSAFRLRCSRNKAEI
jgi:hypothetical protein